MLQFEVLIFKFFTIYGLSTSTIATCKISALSRDQHYCTNTCTHLNHEIRNYAMETAPFISETFFSGAQSTEIFCAKRFYNKTNTKQPAMLAFLKIVASYTLPQVHYTVILTHHSIMMYTRLTGCLWNHIIVNL